MDNLSEQREELFSVESIFNVYEKNFIFENKLPQSGHFKANVWLPTPFYVTYNVDSLRNRESATQVSASNSSNIETFEVKHLPPINLFFELPETYPSHTCPSFFLSCNWLTLQQLSVLCKHIESMWEKDVQVLYLWCQFLESEVIEFLCLQQTLDITEHLKYKASNAFRNTAQSMEIFSPEKSHAFSNNRCEQIIDSNNSYPKFSKIPDTKDFPTIKPSISGGSGPLDCRAFNDLTDGRSLVLMLKNYNDFKAAEVFNRKHQECGVCLTTKLGAEFMVFKTCNHAFCKECLKGFFEVHIREGNVNCLNCPSEKCSSQADISMVRQVVAKDLFERYDSILLSRTLENMSDVAYCPRRWCQSVVLIDSGERIGSCPSCAFVFCPYCKMAYHGVAPCTFKFEDRQALTKRYLEGDDEDREMLDKRHGKRVMKALVEDSLSESWKNSNSKSCPRCKSNIEKNDGCNKMTCFKCGTFFCWTCLTVLNSANPYLHYSETSRCVLFPDDVMDNFFEFGPGEFLHYL